MSRTTKEASVLLKTFANMTEYHRYLQNGVVQDGFKEYQASQEGSEDFTGTKDYAEADKLYLQGDSETAKKIDKQEGITAMIKKYAAQKPMMKKFVSVAGFMPHVPNFIAGVPVNMIAAKRTKVKERVTDVVLNMMIDCGVTVDEIVRTMVELFKAIMMIESNGTRVNVFSAELSKCRSGKQYAGMCVKIKNATQPIDIVKMVYPLVNPSMLRRHNFRFLEVTEGVDPQFNHGYGMVLDECTNVLKKQLKDKHVIDFYKIRNRKSDEIVKIIYNN